MLRTSISPRVFWRGLKVRINFFFDGRGFIFYKKKSFCKYWFLLSGRFEEFWLFLWIIILFGNHDEGLKLFHGFLSWLIDVGWLRKFLIWNSSDIDVMHWLMCHLINHEMLAVNFLEKYHSVNIDLCELRLSWISDQFLFL